MFSLLLCMKCILINSWSVTMNDFVDLRVLRRLVDVNHSSSCLHSSQDGVLKHSVYSITKLDMN